MHPGRLRTQTRQCTRCTKKNPSGPARQTWSSGRTSGRQDGSSLTALAEWRCESRSGGKDVRGLPLAPLKQPLSKGPDTSKEAKDSLSQGQCPSSHLWCCCNCGCWGCCCCCCCCCCWCCCCCCCVQLQNETKRSARSNQLLKVHARQPSQLQCQRNKSRTGSRQVS